MLSAAPPTIVVLRHAGAITVVPLAPNRHPDNGTVLEKVLFQPTQLQTLPACLAAECSEAPATDEPTLGRFCRLQRLLSAKSLPLTSIRFFFFGVRSLCHTS